METSSPSGGNSDDKIFMYISIVFWLLLLITGWICFAVPDLGEKILFVWMYIIIRENSGVLYYPLVIHYVLFYMILVPTLLFITAAFIVYAYHIFMKKDANVLNGMLGNLTKFHFIPLACVSAVFIIGESVDENKGPKGAHYFFIIFFSAIALVSLIFIFMQTKLESPIYAAFTIKHGAYACLIALLIHNIFYCIWYYGYYLRSTKHKDLRDWHKGCHITFSILIGLGNLGVSVFLKEIVISIVNLLIYIGMTVQFFKIDKDFRKYWFSEAPGVIDIFMIVFSLAAIAFLFIRYKGQLIS